MAEFIIQNPSITPDDFTYDPQTNYISAIAGHPLAGNGGGTIEKSDLMWKPTVGSDGYVRWSLASSATTPEAAYISGAQGPAGQDGDDGTSIVLQSVIDVEGGKQVTLAWGDAETSTSSFVIPSGTNGKDGKDGTNGTSVYLDNVSTVAGGTQVTLGWGTSDTSAFVIPSGASGGNGSDGYSPTVMTAELPTSTTHPQGGTSVTITDKTGDHQFNVWNGINGEGATVNLLEGSGIHIEQNGTNYTIGVSGDYALRSELPDVSDMATKTWTSGELDKKIDIPTFDPLGDALKIWNSYTSGWNDFQEVMLNEGVVTFNAFEDPNYPLMNAGHGISGYFDDDDYNFGYHFGLWNDYEQAIQTVSARVMIPDSADVNLKDKYLVLRTKADGTVDGWTDFQNQSYSKTEADGRYVQTAFIDTTLSGNGSNANNKLGVNTNSVPTKDWLDDNYLPLSGGIVSGSTYFSAANGKNMLAVASAATLIGASRQTSAHFGQDTQALGTTWIGVGGDGMYRGFLKYTQDGNVGDLNSNNTMQVEFTPNNKGTIFAKAKNSGNDCPETQILNPTKASCDAMVQSANANLISGPNYMLAKNADGQFVIGAACINCTAITDVTLAPNTYYFVYEV